MEKLNLPSFQANIRYKNNKAEIFDEFRKKFIVLTPEEWVRQHFAHYMVNKKQYPKGLLALEYSFMLQTRKKRLDILAFSNNGKPLLVVECKASTVNINQKVLDQIARYNFAFRVQYLIVTNGIQHFACKLDYDLLSYQFIKDIPSFTELI
ncbi:MAG: type I restriction enzyme HsdR N-terminal domain-containing protein [Bacteroidales bacterium]|jgi:type I site-specific restriction-modification system R (restriction) subunit|nr:type I restriction enzyme HsdR N-terminal domain-containing protein [Bacteroidales bacterium]